MYQKFIVSFVWKPLGTKYFLWVYLVIQNGFFYQNKLITDLYLFRKKGSEINGTKMTSKSISKVSCFFCEEITWNKIFEGLLSYTVLLSF